MRLSIASACLLGAAGFAPAPRASAGRGAAVLRAEPKASSGGSLSKDWIGTAFLVGFAAQSCYDLVDEVPGLFGEKRDLFGTFFDAAVLSWSAGRLLEQTGLTTAGNDDGAAAALAGLESRLTLSVGREDGTWMAKEWGASGARLSLPLQVTFSDERLDLGFPGEEALGGRGARRLECAEGRFVGPKGETVVRTDGGAWTTSAIPGPPGQFKLRFFIDFPDGAERNDVSIPAGRVFFSGACFDRERMEAALPPEVDVVDGPGSMRILTQGGLTIKRNGLTNLYGALGDVNLILGKFTFAPSDAASS